MDTKLTFGQYRGLTLEQVVERDISYAYWCIRGNDLFYVSQDTLEKINTRRGGFRLTVKQCNEMQASLDAKQAEWVRKSEEHQRWRERTREGQDEYSKTVGDARWSDDLGDDEIETGYWNLD